MYTHIYNTHTYNTHTHIYIIIYYHINHTYTLNIQTHIMDLARRTHLSVHVLVGG